MKSGGNCREGEMWGKILEILGKFGAILGRYLATRPHSRVPIKHHGCDELTCSLHCWPHPLRTKNGEIVEIWSKLGQKMGKCGDYWANLGKMGKCGVTMGQVGGVGVGLGVGTCTSSTPITPKKGSGANSSCTIRAWESGSKWDLRGKKRVRRGLGGIGRSQVRPRGRTSEAQVG